MENRSGEGKMPQFKRTPKKIDISATPFKVKSEFRKSSKPKPIMINSNNHTANKTTNTDSFTSNNIQVDSNAESISKNHGNDDDDCNDGTTCHDNNSASQKDGSNNSIQGDNNRNNPNNQTVEAGYKEKPLNNDNNNSPNEGGAYKQSQPATQWPALNDDREERDVLKKKFNFSVMSPKTLGKLFAFAAVGYLWWIDLCP